LITKGYNCVDGDGVCHEKSAELVTKQLMQSQSYQTAIDAVAHRRLARLNPSYQAGVEALVYDIKGMYDKNQTDR
jgi:hypothetical protein